MNRLLWMASVAVLMSGSTGCLRHHTRAQFSNCPECQECPPGGSCQGGGGGLFGRLSNCHSGRTGCVPGPIGWQQGGLNYSSHLGPHGGTAGHPHSGHGPGPGPGYAGGGYPNGMGGPHGYQGPPINPGQPSAQVAYPYYTHRGPRDFLLDNPPSIGR